MITANEARERIKIKNSRLLKAIEQKIEVSINHAVDNLQTSTTVYLDDPLEKLGQDQIIERMQQLGYTIKYKSYSSMRSEDGSQSFTISW